MTHDELKIIAEKWLRTSLYCRYVLVEPNAHKLSGERPDVIGWKNRWCIVVEAKTRRHDLLYDKKKRSRRNGALGHWRIFLTEPNLMEEDDEIPDGWSLYEVRHGRPKHRSGEVYHDGIPTPFESYREREVEFLLSALEGDGLRRRKVAVRE